MNRNKYWFHWILLIVMMFSFSFTSTAKAQDGDETQVFFIPNVFDVETRSRIAATGALSGRTSEKPRDRRFAAPEWQDDAYYRAIRDAYLLASKQLRDVVSLGEGSAATTAMASFLLDQYLNAVSPSNFAVTNPEVVKRTKETNGANLVQGFAHLIEDIASGKGIVQRRNAEQINADANGNN